MSDLRKKVIKLAHSKPELRKHLIPLLREAAVWMEDIPETYYRNFRPRGSSKMGIKARKNVEENYSLKAIAKRYANLYQQLLHFKRRHGR